jgi:hypothetical protein
MKSFLLFYMNLFRDGFWWVVVSLMVDLREELRQSGCGKCGDDMVYYIMCVTYTSACSV